MVFAAGKGTRLQPYTDTMPKALVKVGGVPMIELILKKIIRSGFDDIIINVYHYADMIVDFLERNNNFGAKITISDESDELLETGGGLKKAAWFFDDHKPFLVHNIDILSNIDLEAFYKAHLTNNCLSTLAVKERNTSRSLLINSNGELSGWRNNQTGEEKIPVMDKENLIPIAFSAIHVMSPDILPLITETGKFSITDVYLRLIKEHRIMTYRHDADFWFDMGRTEFLSQAAPYVGLTGR